MGEFSVELHLNVRTDLAVVHLKIDTIELALARHLAYRHCDSTVQMPI